MNGLRKLVTCKKCMNFLDSPIRLPCNKVICSRHVEELKETCNSNKIKCEFCNSLHEIPENGFTVDEELNEILLNNEHLTDEEKKCDHEIQTKIERYYKNLEYLKNNSNVNDKIAALKKNIDSEVDKLKYRIDNIRDILFKDIETESIKIIEEVDLNDMKNKINETTLIWQKEKNSKEIEVKKSFETNLNLVIKQIEEKKSSILYLENSLEKLNISSNDIFYKSDKFLGDLIIQKGKFKKFVLHYLY